MIRRGRGWADFERDLETVLSAAEEEQRRASWLGRLWRGFCAGYRDALAPRVAPLPNIQAPTRADAERELAEAMARHGLKQSDRRHQAGRES